MLRTEKKLNFYNYVVFFMVENNIKQKPTKLPTLRIFWQIKTNFSRKL